MNSPESEPGSPPGQGRTTEKRGPSPKVVRIVALVVGALMIVVGILRLFGVGSAPPETDPQEAIDAATDIVEQQRLEGEVRQYVLDNDPLIDPGESITVRCTELSEAKYSCDVMKTGDLVGGDHLTIEVFMDGTWEVVSP